MLGKQVQEEVEGTRESTSERLGEFSEPRSEAFPCKSQGSRGN